MIVQTKHKAYYLGKGNKPIDKLVKTTGWLYKLSRVSRGAEVLASGDPAKVARRAKNKLLGRWLFRKFW